MKIKSSRNGEIILSFTDIGKSCPSRDFLTTQIWLFWLFAKLKFSRKFQNGAIYCHSFMQNKAIKYISLDWSVIELVWKKSKLTHLS